MLSRQVITAELRRVWSPGLRLLPLERPACTAGPWLGPGTCNLDFRRVSTMHRTAKTGPLFLGCENKQCGLC